MYRIPKEYDFRLHHVRPRFKNDMENVLLYMAHCCASLTTLSIDEYKKQLNSQILLYPGNAGKAIKTINNWRTEISALFGFYIENNDTQQTTTGEIAKFLDKEQDLVQFFKYYLFKFQYPGGHLKTDKIKSIIERGIRFKPAHYILKMLFKADENKSKQFGVTKEEATNCVFNDLRVTRDNRDVNETIDLILTNRKNKVEYEHGGDANRYAGDILDYLVQANLLNERHNYYYLNHSEMEAIMVFINDDHYFKGYNSFYGKTIETSELSMIEKEWFSYVNEGLDPNLFKTDLSTFIRHEQQDTYADSIDKKISEILQGIGTTKDIGDLGENLIIGHEKVRLINLGREDLIHLINKIPTSFAVGYDIQSVEENMEKRYIEAKTTISNQPLKMLNFHLTENEWNTAFSLQDNYFVYRLMINKQQKVIYILQNPIKLYKTDKIGMSMHNGADISFKEDVAEKIDLLLWKR